MTENKKNNANECKNCQGFFRCYNKYSPCYLMYCGEYPGTGREYSEVVNKEDKGEDKAG